MSLYQMVFADGEDGLPLLGSLGFKSTGDVGRYRSSWIERGDDGKPRIAIYTRNGGGNRESYEVTIKKLQNHKNYLSDSDDDFDCTYATFYFSVPDNLKAILDKEVPDWLEKLQEKVDMSERWKKAIDSIGKTK